MLELKGPWNEIFPQSTFHGSRSLRRHIGLVQMLAPFLTILWPEAINQLLYLRQNIKVLKCSQLGQLDEVDMNNTIWNVKIKDHWSHIWVLKRDVLPAVPSSRLYLAHDGLVSGSYWIHHVLSGVPDCKKVFSIFRLFNGVFTILDSQQAFISTEFVCHKVSANLPIVQILRENALNIYFWMF